MENMDINFKDLFQEAKEKAAFVKKVVVGGPEVKFPYMKIEDGTLTLDNWTWKVAGIVTPLLLKEGATRWVIPLLLGSFTGMTQLMIVVAILVGLTQTKFGKPVEEGEEIHTSADKGVVEFMNKGLWGLFLDYGIQSGIGNLERGWVSYWKKPQITTAIVVES